MRFLKEVYLTSRFLLIITGIVLLFFFGYFVPFLFFTAKIVLIAFVIIIIVESFILFVSNGNVYAERVNDDRFSNGDDNAVKIVLTNNYTINIKAKIIDELPFIFQIRDFEINSQLDKSILDLLKEVNINSVLLISMFHQCLILSVVVLDLIKTKMLLYILLTYK